MSSQASPRTAPVAPVEGPSADALKQPLSGAWYCVGEASAFRRGRLAGIELHGDKLVVGRGDDGALFALRDRCPHRGMALSKGKLVEGEILCPFHGWRFRTDGRCASIPALSFNDQADFSRIEVLSFPVVETAGLVWVHLGRDPSEAPPVPDLDFEPRGMLVETLIVESSFDLVALSFVDPAHVAYVHDSWWFRPSKTLREKVKTFSPSPFGFTMTSHKTTQTSPVYRLLGAVPDVEIEFRLPGVRLERISAGAKRLANYTFATPLSANRTALINAIYWNLPGLSLVKPLARPFVRQFLGQDKSVLEAAQEGLDRKPTMVLLGQSDLPSQWYFSLKREFLRAGAERGSFVNPLREQELRWRS